MFIRRLAAATAALLPLAGAAPAHAASTAPPTITFVQAHDVSEPQNAGLIAPARIDIWAHDDDSPSGPVSGTVVVQRTGDPSTAITTTWHTGAQGGATVLVTPTSTGTWYVTSVTATASNGTSSTYTGPGASFVVTTVDDVHPPVSPGETSLREGSLTVPVGVEISDPFYVIAHDDNSGGDATGIRRGAVTMTSSTGLSVTQAFDMNTPTPWQFVIPASLNNAPATWRITSGWDEDWAGHRGSLVDPFQAAITTVAPSTGCDSAHPDLSADNPCLLTGLDSDHHVQAQVRVVDAPAQGTCYTVARGAVTLRMPGEWGFLGGTPWQHIQQRGVSSWSEASGVQRGRGSMVTVVQVRHARREAPIAARVTRLMRSPRVPVAYVTDRAAGTTSYRLMQTGPLAEGDAANGIARVTAYTPAITVTTGAHAGAVWGGTALPRCAPGGQAAVSEHLTNTMVRGRAHASVTTTTYYWPGARIPKRIR